MPRFAGTGDSATEQLVAQLFALIGQMTRFARTDDDALALTTTQRLALMELSRATSLRLHELARRIGTSPSTASRAVDVLLEAGFLERVPDPTDRRAVQIRLSDEGREKIATRLARAAKTLEPAVTAMPPADRERIVSLLTRLNDALRD